jgi:hypothetical protein
MALHGLKANQTEIKHHLFTTPSKLKSVIPTKKSKQEV